MSQKNDNTLVKNASFLMVAALVSKIIGMLYKSPLSTTLGSQSFALFQYAQNAYFILLMIASFSIPQAVSKIMAEKIAFRRYRDAQKVFYCSLLYAVVAGGAVALFCVFGASLMVPDTMADARLALRMLGPTIFLSGILGVFRGYFQAFRVMMPTSLSQIVEQIFVAVFALLLSSRLMALHAAEGVSAEARWGAAGATLGTGAGVSAALVFMIAIYIMNRSGIRRRIANDTVSRNESASEVIKSILLIVMPIIFSAFIYNVNGYINSYMYTDIMGKRQVIGQELLQVLYAENGYFMTLINIPLTLAGTAPMSMIPEVSGHYARGDIKTANQKIDRASWISMIISIPSAVGLAVLAQPVTRLIFPGTNGSAGRQMLLGAITIILTGNSNITNGVLQGIGKANIPMINAAIALGANIVMMELMLRLTNLGIYAVVIAMIGYSVVVCVLNERAVHKYLGYRTPWKWAYLTPLVASVPMAAVAGGVYYGLYIILHSNFLSLVPALALAVLTYFVVYLQISHPTEEEILMLPGGSLILRFAGRLGISVR